MNPQTREALREIRERADERVNTVMAAHDRRELLRMLDETTARAEAAERDARRWREAISSAISYANGRESEWGSRAESAFAFLYAAIAEGVE